jgi:Co/Zn/Cd efflux system component
MSRTATQGLLMVGAFIGLLVVVALAFIELDGDGYFMTKRSLRHGMKSAMATLAGGFLARLFVVAGLMLLFRRTEAIDPAAFALTFMVFFFAYLGLEMVLVERSTARAREAV